MRDSLHSHPPGPQGRPSYLIEEAREVSAGRVTTRHFLFSNGRIRARVGGNGTFELKRRYGPMGTLGGLRLDAAELDLVRLACRRWVAERDGWASFFTCPTAGCLAGVWYVQAQGPDAKPEEVGWGPSEAEVRGRAFDNEDELRPLDHPVDLADGFTLVAELWRREPLLGYPRAVRVGEVVRLSATMDLRAGRRVAWIQRKEVRCALEAGEEGFLDELAAL